MNIILLFILFLICCLLADAIRHFYLTRLERRIGLSGSNIKILLLNTPSYLRNALRMAILFLAIYFWNDQPMFIIFTALMIKLSTKNRQYGYGPIDISSLAALMVSALYIHFFKTSGFIPGFNVLGVTSFAISLLSIYIFSKDKEEPEASSTLLIIALNSSFIGSYYGINNLYILLPLSVIAYFLQMLCEWLVPKTNMVKKMEHSVKIILFSSLVVLTIAIGWITLRGTY